MKLSAEGRKRLTTREGVKLKAYQDTKGIWTIGIGHTSMAGAPEVTPGLTITAAQCDEIFARDIVQYENAVNKAVKVQLLQNEFDACVSMCYNVGVSGFSGSSVVRELNSGNKAGAAEAFLKWNKPPEIMGRRRSEVAQFKTPYANLAPVATKPTSIPAPSPAPETKKNPVWNFLKGMFK